MVTSTRVRDRGWLIKSTYSDVLSNGNFSCKISHRLGDIRVLFERVVKGTSRASQRSNDISASYHNRILRVMRDRQTESERAREKRETWERASERESEERESEREIRERANRERDIAFRELSLPSRDIESKNQVRDITPTIFPFVDFWVQVQESRYKTVQPSSL